MYRQCFVMLVASAIFVPTLYGFVLLLTVHHLLVSVQCAKSNKLGIHHGTDVPEGQWPFMVALRANKTGYKRICGGTIINDNTVLTAGHCLKDKMPEKLLAYIGHVELDPVVEADMYPLVKFIIHPKYDDNNKTYDIGLVKLDRKIDSKILKKVCLADPDSNAEGEKCVVAGWGRDENNDIPNNLKQVNIVWSNVLLSNRHLTPPTDIIPFDQCDKKYESLNLICAGFLDDRRDTCSGDSGGPLLCPSKQNPDWFVQFGVNSFSNKACGKGPSYLAKVSEYIDWIAENAED